MEIQYSGWSMWQGLQTITNLKVRPAKNADVHSQMSLTPMQSLTYFTLDKQSRIPENIKTMGFQLSKAEVRRTLK